MTDYTGTKTWKKRVANRKQPDYLSYLLRLWRVGKQVYPDSKTEQAVWRASLESPHTGERWNFAGLNDLFEFLRTQTGYPSQRVELEEPAALSESRG